MQSVHDFYKTVAEPLLAQLLKGKVSLTVATTFLESVKQVSIKHCNSLLVMLQLRPPRPDDRFYGLYPELSLTNKECTLRLASLSDSDACSLMNEMLFARLKAERYYQQLAKQLTSSQDKHYLRKPIAELQMKTMQVTATLRENLASHIFSRLETTCLQSLVTQNWSFHKDSFTSTSWVDRVSSQVGPFESMKYLSSVPPRPNKKSIVLSPSRGLTTWRLQMIQVHRDLTKNLAPFEQPLRHGIVPATNSMVIQIFNTVLLESCQSIMGKLIAIKPSRARSRQYLLDLAYFSWCLENFSQWVALHTLLAMLADPKQRDQEDELLDA